MASLDRRGRAWGGSVGRVWLALAIVAVAAPKTALRAQGVLDEYVAQGLRHNLGLQQATLTVEQRQAGVREARGNFLPSATLNARYSEISGRTVNIGDFINPAYQALNNLLGSNQFPTDIDVRLPVKQETSVRLAQPIFQPQVISGYRAARAVRDASAAQRDAAARSLEAEIRTAYVQYATVRRVAELRTATVALLEEQQRVVSRLVANGVATPDALSRVNAERSEAVQNEAAAKQLVDAAAQHFNLLLGRALMDSIVVLDETALAPGPMPTLEQALAGSGAREEFRAVAAAQRATTQQKRVAQGTYLPNLALAVDYGFQGNDYDFSPNADFTMVTLVASWNLFNGFKDRARVEQVQLERERLSVQEEELRRGVELQVRMAWQAAAVAQAAIATADDQRTAAQRTHQLVQRRFEEGLATPLELSQARLQLTAAEMNAILTRFDYIARRVELDRAAALSGASREIGQ